MINFSRMQADVANKTITLKKDYVYKKETIKFFKEMPEAISHILKTTVITENDFPAKDQQRGEK